MMHQEIAEKAKAAQTETNPGAQLVRADDS